MLQNIRRLLNMLSGNLRNMKQCVYARLQLYECAKVCHTCYTYPLLHCLLHICQQRSATDSDPRTSGSGRSWSSLDILDQDSQLLANLEYLLRILNTSPGHLRDVKQTICSAQVDECTKIGNVLYNALYHIAYMDALEELFLHLCLLSNKKLLAVTDDSSSAAD